MPTLNYHQLKYFQVKSKSIKQDHPEQQSNHQKFLIFINFFQYLCLFQSPFHKKMLFAFDSSLTHSILSSSQQLSFAIFIYLNTTILLNYYLFLCIKVGCLTHYTAQQQQSYIIPAYQFKMFRQNEWAQTQKYEKHLKRLIKMRISHSEGSVKTSSARMNSLSQDRTIKKLKTETPNQNKLKTKQHSLSNRKLPVVLPLVSKNQRQLLDKYLSTTKIPNRQTEIVLQNYLLSRRIIGTKPCIDTSKFDKDFRSHERYSHLRSRSKLQAINLSQSRLLKYKQFQISQKKRLESKSKPIQGHGKFIFTVKIINIQKIIKSRSEQCIYNIKIYSNKHTYQYQHVKTLIDSFSFNFRKKDIKFPCQIRVQISQIIQTECKQMGSFIINATDLFSHLTQSHNIEEFNFQKQEIQSIHSKRTQKLIGTINFVYSIRRACPIPIAEDKSVAPLV